MQCARQEQIDQMLCISIDLESYPAMLEQVSAYDSIFVSVGVHPNVTTGLEPEVLDLVRLGSHSKVVAMGETGLDYFRSEGDLSWQHERFRRHINAAKQLKKPLIIHTRDAGDDTLKILQEEGADSVGGVIHCFTENWEFARHALNLNFYISFSGIVTFKNAKAIQDAAKKVPADRYLIETDSPYLAPVPFRGKPNYPIYVKQVASCLAELRNTSLAVIAEQSSHNFCRLFQV